MNLLVLLLVVRHYAYYHVPEGMQSGFFGIMASLAIIVCVATASVPRPLKAWAIGEEAMVSGCSAAWMLWPWEPSGELCSDQLGIKVSVIGLLWLTMAMMASVNVARTESRK